jgi:hypothetical protein
MIILQSEELIKSIDFDYEKADDLSIDDLLHIAGIEFWVSYIVMDHTFNNRFDSNVTELKEFGWNINCIIEAGIPLGSSISSLSNIITKRPQVGHSTMSAVGEYIFIKDKNMEEIISVLKRIIKMRAFL